jgi:uroporphyrinogen decarboxylase
MLESCSRPDIVMQISPASAAIRKSTRRLLQRHRRPLRAIGLGLDIKPGVGPIVAEPIRSADDLARLRPLESDDVLSDTGW